MNPGKVHRLVAMSAGRDGGTGESAAGTRPAIVARGLTRDFPGVRALDDLTLDVPRGAIFGFLGRNGAGKTTTIRLLLGLIEPTGGEALVLGYDPVSESAAVRKRCGVLLEHSGLVERLTAADNLDLYGRIWRMRKDMRAARIEELLRRVGLWERREDPVRDWSRGMKQKLAIARALMHRPSLIFLDEPTAGLDPVAAAELREDLLRLASRERVTVFLTTHNLAEAERLCDLVGVIREGRLLSVGSPAEIGARYTHPRLRIQGGGLTENVVELLRARQEVDAVEIGNGHLLVSLAQGGRIPPLVSFLVRLGVEVEEVTRVGNTLEDGVLSLFHDGGGVPVPPLRAAGGSDA
jgi:ABC-2 type transport system ATP-binding protein